MVLAGLQYYSSSLQDYYMYEVTVGTEYDKSSFFHPRSGGFHIFDFLQNNHTGCHVYLSIKAYQGKKSKGKWTEETSV